MDRRKMLGLVGGGAAGLLAMKAQTAQAQHEGHHDKVHQDCLKACGDCARSCDELFHHCLHLIEQGHKEHAKPAQLAVDCAEFCILSGRLMARDSELMGPGCDACATACKRCGDECAKHDDDMMKACAEACRKCEKACTDMVKAMRGTGR